MHQLADLKKTTLSDINEKGSLLIMVSVGVIIIAVAGLIYLYFTYKDLSKTSYIPEPSPTISSSPPLSPENDAAYNEVKERFNLTPEQLEILSRVNENEQ